MRIRKKGSALILTIAVVSMLLILALSIMAATTATRRLTQHSDNMSNMKMLAQTGADYGLSVLKDAITAHIENPKDTIGTGTVDNPISVDTGSNVYTKVNKTSYALSSILQDVELENGGTDNKKLLSDAAFPYKDSATSSEFHFAAYINAVDGKGVDLTSVRAGDCFIQYFDGTDIAIKDLNDDISNKACIEMKVSAVGRNIAGGLMYKQVDVFVDKASITNYFLDKIVNHTMTVMNTDKTITALSSWEVKDTTVATASVDGSVFFNAAGINLPGPSANMTNAVSISEGIEGKNAAGSNVLGSNVFTPRSLQYYKLMPKSPASSDYKSALNFDQYTLLYPSSAANALPFMLVYKVKQGTGSVDFNQIVFGDGPASYMDASKYDQTTPHGYESNRNGIRYFVSKNFVSNNGTSGYTNDVDLAKLFKLVIVYGDLDMDGRSVYYDGLLNPATDDSQPLSPSYFRSMVATNYIIICLGKVRISGSLDMENSAIFANQIEFENANDNDVKLNNANDGVDSGVSTVTNVTIDGIARLSSSTALSQQLNNVYYSWPTNAWGYFDGNKAQMINEYLNQNLPFEYRKGLQFNIVSWKEN